MTGVTGVQSTSSQAQPQAQPPHVVQIGETAESIARQHGVTVDALMAANPQLLLPSFVSPGQVLSVPPATMCYADAPFTNPTTAATPAATPTPPEAAGASPGGGTGIKVEFGLQPLNGQGATFAAGVEQLNGTTTYTGSVRVGTQVGFEAQARQAGIEVTAGAGTQMAFEVVSPPNVGPLTPAQLAAINPFDATTIPPGVSVKIDASQFIGTQYEAQVRHAVISEGVKFEAGVTYQVQRSSDGNSAQIGLGPYAAVEQAFGAGFAAGPLTVQLGRTDSLRTNALVVEKLDLSRGEPRSTGTSLTTTREYVSSSGLRINAGPLQVELGIGENAGLSTITMNSDGSQSVSSTLYYGTGVPVTIGQTFNADGTERVADRTYNYTVRVDESNRQLLHVAMGGSAETAAATSLRAGDTVVISYTQTQMEALRTDFEAARAANPNDPQISSSLDARAEGLNDPLLNFATSLVQENFHGRSDFLFAETLFTVSDLRDGSYNNGSFAANPGEAWVVNPGQPAVRFTP